MGAGTGKAEGGGCLREGVSTLGHVRGRSGAERRRRQAPCRSVSEISVRKLKQRRHPGSASEAQQVPVFPLKGDVT
ncbi:MAG: hypothetical protein J5490_08425 [Bacteroidales bacterium]|nr:hypothetical protein [Bacteroidales bacterium]